jgi:hypothetical protein
MISWFLVVSPQQSRGATLDQKIDDKRTEIASAKLVAKRIDPKADRVKLRAAAIAMPNGVEMESLLVELMHAAHAGDVRLDSITTQPLAPLSGYSAVPFDVKVTGSYLGIKRFLHRLETQTEGNGDRLRARGRLFAIDSLDFAPGENSLPQLAATVHLNAFVFTPSAPAPPAAAPSTSSPASAAGRTP